LHHQTGRPASNSIDLPHGCISVGQISVGCPTPTNAALPKIESSTADTARNTVAPARRTTVGRRVLPHAICEPASSVAALRARTSRPESSSGSAAAAARELLYAVKSIDAAVVVVVVVVVVVDQVCTCTECQSCNVLTPPCTQYEPHMHHSSGIVVLLLPWFCYRLRPEWLRRKVAEIDQACHE
jgi:hypothetical protein